MEDSITFIVIGFQVMALFSFYLFTNLHFLIKDVRRLEEEVRKK